MRDPAQFAHLEDHLAAFPEGLLLMEDDIPAVTFFNVCRSKGRQGNKSKIVLLDLD